jgi:hypothetical protein
MPAALAVPANRSTTNSYLLLFCLRWLTAAARTSPIMMMITVYFSYHMKPKPKARIAKSISIVSPMNNIRS